MDWFNVIVMAIGLAMDCCAVSVVQGLNEGRWHRRALLLAGIFGLFHAGMPLIGYYAGSLAVDFMHRYAPWIALILLSGLGSKMIYESFHHHDGETKRADWRLINLLTLAVATSIDVLATGLILVPYPDWLYPAVLTIGAITACFSLAGYLGGVFIGKLKFNMELVGGLVLIGLGVKIFIEGICS